MWETKTDTASVPTPPASVTSCVFESPKSNETLVIADELLEPTAVRLTEKGAVPKVLGSTVRLSQISSPLES